MSPEPGTAAAAIQVRDVTKRFGEYVALDRVSLDVAAGELLALLGPSGSGKTTLLRVVAGLEAPDHGSVLLDGEDATRRHARDRRVGFVFQHYALFRHMTVFENVAFGLRVQPRRIRPPEAEIRRRVRELLELVQLGPLGERYPAQLSGGQRQRVGLARALAVQPKVLLLDEPFGALDAKVRKELRRWLRRLHDEIGITSVFVTHDQDEALEVADRVVVMHQGRVEQVGTPEEVYDRPATPFVYTFLGSVNLFHARLHNGRVHLGSAGLEGAPGPEGAEARGGAGGAGGAGGLEGAAQGPGPNGRAVAFVRTHEVEIATAPNGATFEAVVTHARALGPLVRVELESPEYAEPIEAELSRERFAELGLRRGDRVFVRPRRARVFFPDAPPVEATPDPEWVL